MVVTNKIEEYYITFTILAIKVIITENKDDCNINTGICNSLPCN